MRTRQKHTRNQRLLPPQSGKHFTSKSGSKESKCTKLAKNLDSLCKPKVQDVSLNLLLPGSSTLLSDTEPIQSTEPPLHLLAVAGDPTEASGRPKGRNDFMPKACSPFSIFEPLDCRRRPHKYDFWFAVLDVLGQASMKASLPCRSLVPVITDLDICKSPDIPEVRLLLQSVLMRSLQQLISLVAAPDTYVVGLFGVLLHFDT